MVNEGYSYYHLICAWCGKLMGTYLGHVEGGISHGICEVCARDEETKLRLVFHDSGAFNQ